MKCVCIISYIFALSICFSCIFSYQTDWIGCISHHEAKELLKLGKKERNKTVMESINLGLSKQSIFLSDSGISLTPTSRVILSWKQIEKIFKKQRGCYALYADGSEPEKINTFSEKTNLAASLCPPLSKSGAPTLLLGGYTMHRIAGDDMNPMIDTENKVSSVAIRVSDKVLDTCMGLGYTAITSAKKVGPTGSVVTIEYDPASVEMASFNPWSQGLFDQTLPISIIEGEASEVIKTFPDNNFNVIIHDPPTATLCKHDLFGLSFYRSLFRVLNKHTGRLFHYIGNSESKESGRLYKGIMDRLREAGFGKLQIDPKAFGVTATTY